MYVCIFLEVYILNVWIKLEMEKGIKIKTKKDVVRI